MWCMANLVMQSTAIARAAEKPAARLLQPIPPSTKLHLRSSAGMRNSKHSALQRVCIACFALFAVRRYLVSVMVCRAFFDYALAALIQRQMPQKHTSSLAPRRIGMISTTPCHSTARDLEASRAQGGTIMNNTGG